MKKLIELLNEYEKSGLNEFELEKYEEWWYCEWNGRIFRGNWENNNELTPYELCSKHYGFIKRLVDNDKIDLEKLDEKAERKPQYTFTDDDGRLGFKLFEVYESLLMLLSISDSPIEFLISILK